MTLPRHPFIRFTSHGLRYHVVVLCLWQEPDAIHPTWRFSLEGLQATDRLGFGSLEDLIEHIRALITAPVDP